MTICNCCRQPYAGDPGGYHKGEPVCDGCAEALTRSNLTVTSEP